ncbi:hypothetical protein LGZ99_20885 [Photorhabdus temperata]|uniref:hypothetical protein n=1 Tax=Photorhabdus temperata TaxID=574560 RepID=UPI0021D4EC7C|nr:hypothetical protein [Photorhabdus temperata]MCT8349584.1 hypothetical protein [Photorhabdus temperata]
MRNLLIPTIFLLAGCGDETENSVQIEPEKSPASVFSIATDDPTINQLLPTIRKMCPGLDKYADQFTDVTVYENSYPSRTTIKFHIDENAKLLNDYMANGNNCFLDIEDNETVLSISKSACQSVCLDQQNVPGGTLELKL